MLSTLQKLFFRRRFGAHRLIGLVFLIQYAVSVYLFLTNYDRWMHSKLVWTVPLTGLAQSTNAAMTFRFLPRTEVPGFAAVADKSILSYNTVIENSFYALQLLFVCCYLREDIRENIIRHKLAFGVVEPFFVFFIFYARDLWPSSRIHKAIESADTTTTPANRLKLIVSAHAIKAFYLFAKHFVGFMPLYLVFLGRVGSEEQRLLYAVQVLSSYAATVSIFIHTLKFKGYIGPMTAVVAYDIIIPGFLFLYYRMLFVILRNADVACICGIGMLLNLLPKPTFHVYQLIIAATFYGGYVTSKPLFEFDVARGLAMGGGLVVSALLLIRFVPRASSRKAMGGNHNDSREAEASLKRE